MRVNGKMVKDMVWVLKREADGFIGGNGRRALRGGTVSGNRTLPQPNTRERGRMDSKMDTDLKPMPMTVKKKQIVCHFVPFFKRNLESCLKLLKIVIHCPQQKMSQV